MKEQLKNYKELDLYPRWVDKLQLVPQVDYQDEQKNINQVDQKNKLNNIQLSKTQDMKIQETWTKAEKLFIIIYNELYKMNPGLNKEELMLKFTVLLKTKYNQELSFKEKFSIQNLLDCTHKFVTNDNACNRFNNLFRLLGESPINIKKGNFPIDICKVNSIPYDKYIVYDFKDTISILKGSFYQDHILSKINYQINMKPELMSLKTKQIQLSYLQSKKNNPELAYKLKKEHPFEQLYINKNVKLEFNAYKDVFNNKKSSNDNNLSALSLIKPKPSNSNNNSSIVYVNVIKPKTSSYSSNNSSALSLIKPKNSNNGNNNSSQRTSYEFKPLKNYNEFYEFIPYKEISLFSFISVIKNLILSIELDYNSQFRFFINLCFNSEFRFYIFQIFIHLDWYKYYIVIKIFIIKQIKFFLRKK